MPRVVKHLTNRRTVLTTNNDFYKTPAYATKALMYYERFQGIIAEPCCGTGEMAEVLKQKYYHVYASDIVDRGYGKVQNFFDFNSIYHNVVTNPPYDIAEDIIEHALKHTTNKVCMLLRLAFLEGQGRFNKFYKYNPPNRIRVFSERVSMYKGDDVRTDGGTTAYAWFIWSNVYNGLPITSSEISWIKPGFKEGKVKRFIYGKKRHTVL